MKVVVEKVPEGVRVSVTTDTAKAPVTFVIHPAQMPMIQQVLQTAMNASKFKFEAQL